MLDTCKELFPTEENFPRIDNETQITNTYVFNIHKKLNGDIEIDIAFSPLVRVTPVKVKSSLFTKPNESILLKFDSVNLFRMLLTDNPEDENAFAHKMKTFAYWNMFIKRKNATTEKSKYTFADSREPELKFKEYRFIEEGIIQLENQPEQKVLAVYSEIDRITGSYIAKHKKNSEYQLHLSFHNDFEECLDTLCRKLPHIGVRPENIDHLATILTNMNNSMLEEIATNS